MLGENTWLKKLGLNTICELHHQIFQHTQEVGTDITLGLIYTHKHYNIKKLPLFMSSSRRRGISPSAWTWKHNQFWFWIISTVKLCKIIQTWAVAIFWDVWLYLTYPLYLWHMQLNCQIHHFLHICQQQPCFPQSCMAASWSHPALQDMNWPSEAGCLLQTSDGAKIKTLNKASISAVN